MASPQVLDPESLLAPIDGDDPAGARPSILDRNKLKEYREDFDPERDLSEEDRRDPKYAEAQKKVPQWDKVLQFGTQYFSRTGKDLTVAMAMTEALTKQTGFAGLRDGLKLLRRLCEDCWDRMHPVIDDPTNPDDVEGRVAPFAFIDDDIKTPFFPNSVRSIPLLTTPDGVDVSFAACQTYGPDSPAKVTQEDFRAAVSSANEGQVERIRTMNEDIDAALIELQALVDVLDAKAGSNAPGLGGLRKAIQDCQSMTQEVVRLRGSGAEVEPEADEAEVGGAEGGTSGGGGGGLGAVRSRDDVYAKFNELTIILERIDPHSPVPFLIRRAMEMRDLKFPELVDKLTSAKPVLDFLRVPLNEEPPQ
jgi:type VI secretion system protein ImpA